MDIVNLLVVLLLACVMTLCSEVRVLVTELVFLFFVHALALVTLYAFIRVFVFSSRESPQERARLSSSGGARGTSRCDSENSSVRTSREPAFLSELQSPAMEEALHAGASPAAEGMTNTVKYYAVRYGRPPGIYSTWHECKKHVIGFPGARYKSFYSMAEANKFMQG